MKINNAYNAQTALLSFILACLYVAVLLRAHFGSKFTFVIAVSALMLVSNVSGIVVEVANFKLIGQYVQGQTEYPSSVYVWVVVQGVSAMVRDATFNVAHWEFAYKYFKISYEVPVILRGDTMSSRSISFFNSVYFGLLAFNILVAVASGVDFILYNLAVFNGSDMSQATILWSEAFHFLIGIA